MVRRLSLAAALLMLPSPAQGQDTFTIRIRRPAQGESSVVEKTEEGSQRVKATDAKGTVLKDEEAKDGYALTYVETILEQKPGERAVRVRRAYRKATATAAGKAKELPYQGKTVLIEKKGDRYAFRIEGGGELTGGDAKLLDVEFNRKKLGPGEFEEMFLSKRPVKVGETWEGDRAAVSKAFAEGTGIEVRAEKTVVTGKLVKTYVRDGRQFGVLALHAEFTPVSFPAGDKRMPVRPESRIVLDRTVDGCIDGSAVSWGAAVRTSTTAVALRPSPEQPMVRIKITIATSGTDRRGEK
jgi:hypothetical protein